MTLCVPLENRRAEAVRVVCRLALGLVWLYEGLVPKLIFVRPDQLDLVERSGLSFGNAALTLQILGLAQVLFAIWLMSGRGERLAVLIATAGMGVLIVLVARGNPWMLTDPYGALVKDLCLIACAYAVWILSPRPQRKQSALVLTR